MDNKVEISQVFKVVNWKAVNYIMDLLTEYEDAGGDYKITLGCNGYAIWGITVRRVMTRRMLIYISI